MTENASPARSARPAIRFDRNELAGAFGDIGTDLPLVVAMILVARLDCASVLIVFGLMQVLTGLYYRMPMPVQPLKAVAALVIAQQANGNVLYGAGLAIGVTMLLLTATGLLTWLARVVPKSVVRGIQLGLGLQLASLALRNFIPADGVNGYWLAGLGFLITLLLWGNRKYPAALFVVLLGVIYAFAFKLDWAALPNAIGFNLPQLHRPAWDDIVTGFIVLALPQIPLSLGNSILATRQIAADLFPERRLSIPQIGLTYSLMNLINPFLGGVPTCHGSGGMAGHYAFGARTGGSVILYGSLFLALGLVFSPGLEQIIQIFPRPILGVILFFEGLVLISLLRDLLAAKTDLLIACLVGLAAFAVPSYGYLIGLVGGTLLAHCLPQETPRIA